MSALRDALAQIAPPAIAAALGFVWRTGRFTIEGGDHVEAILRCDSPIILALWHGRMAMLGPALGPRARFHTLISNHRDGELIARTVERFGVPAIRGSSADTRKRRDNGGAAALRAMIRVLNGGGHVAITPDGPRGPARRLSEGTLTLARLSGRPFVPVAWSAHGLRRAASWDRFAWVPPFARGVVLFGDPVSVPRQIADQDIETWRLRLQAALDAVTDEADRCCGVAVDPRAGAA